jgi:hypothetical protein
VAAILVAAIPLTAQQQGARQNSTGGNSPHETTSTVVDGSRVTITYGRPFAHGRKIWGELVPWGKAWRTGSDEATTLITQQPIVIGETTVPAGAYTLYTVPMQEGASKLAISTRLGGWGIPVDEKNDLARVDMKKDATDKPYEQLTIAVEKGSSGGGMIKISWENTQYSVPFTVKK